MLAEFAPSSKATYVNAITQERLRNPNRLAKLSAKPLTECRPICCGENHPIGYDKQTV